MTATIPTAAVRDVSRWRARYAAPMSAATRPTRPERDVETTRARIITRPAAPTQAALVPSHSTAAATTGARPPGDDRWWPNVDDTYAAASGQAISTQVAK